MRGGRPSASILRALSKTPTSRASHACATAAESADLQIGSLSCLVCAPAWPRGEETPYRAISRVFGVRVDPDVVGVLSR